MIEPLIHVTLPTPSLVSMNSSSDYLIESVYIICFYLLLRPLDNLLFCGRLTTAHMNSVCLYDMESWRDNLLSPVPILGALSKTVFLPGGLWKNGSNAFVRVSPCLESRLQKAPEK